MTTTDQQRGNRQKKRVTDTVGDACPRGRGWGNGQQQGEAMRQGSGDRRRSITISAAAATVVYIGRTARTNAPPSDWWMAGKRASANWNPLSKRKCTFDGLAGTRCAPHNGRAMHRVTSNIPVSPVWLECLNQLATARPCANGQRKPLRTFGVNAANDTVQRPHRSVSTA